MNKLTRVEKKRRRKRFVLRLILFFALGTISIAYLFKSGFFNINNINITGNNTLSKELLVNASGINKEENIFKISLSNGEDEIRKLPYIKVVKIKRKLPKTIDINVIERTGVAQIKSISTYMLLDMEGYILELRDNKTENLPTLTGFNINNILPGDNIFENQNGSKVEELIGDGDNHNMLSKIHEISYESEENINIILNNGISVAFGPLDNVKYKLRYLNEILIDIEENNRVVKMIMMNKGEHAILVTDN